MGLSGCMIQHYNKISKQAYCLCSSAGEKSIYTLMLTQHSRDHINPSVSYVYAGATDILYVDKAAAVLKWGESPLLLTD